LKQEFGRLAARPWNIVLFEKVFLEELVSKFATASPERVSYFDSYPYFILNYDYHVLP